MTQLEPALVIIVVCALAGCSGIAMHGDCTVVMKVEETFHCQPGGKVEHVRVPLPQ